jgi:DNA polymerase-3 subunit epsilon
MLNKILKLERPLAMFDLETTGINAASERIVQIAVTMHYPDKDPKVWMTLVNPEKPILNSGVHRITDDMVRDSPKFRDIAPVLAPSLLKADFGGQNVKGFDIPFLKAEMQRAGVPFPWDNDVIDTVLIARLMIPHTLANLYKRFVDKNGMPENTAHDAANDVQYTEQVLAGMLTEFENIPRTVPELAEFCIGRSADAIDKEGKFIWINDEPCINFGKHKGTPLKRVDKGYLVWMINTPNFPDDAIIIAGDALNGKFPVRG